MIGTIGSLVQETSNRLRWLLAVSLYTTACVSTSMLLGALLGTVGHIARRTVCGGGVCGSISMVGEGLVGLLAVAYALSDVGAFRLPRPTLRYAVPATWWRAWGPYGAAISYGAALGVGVMTYIAFGSFYVLCAWCFVRGDTAYGTLLLGTYGAARALVIFPASWGVYRRRASVMTISAWLASPLFDQKRAQRVVAVALSLFGVLVVVSALGKVLTTLPH